MPDLIQQGQEWEAAKRVEWRSVHVTIQRGLLQTAGVPATIGSTTIFASDAAGFTIEEKTRDFIIDATAYMIQGQQVEPTVDDVIIDLSSGSAIPYRVLPQAGGAEKRWSDDYGIAWRIHTKRVS